MCFYCKCKELVPAVNTHVTTISNSVIIIKNVPCVECAQCGEKYYTDEIMEELDILVAQAQKMCSDVFVTEYGKAIAVNGA